MNKEHRIELARKSLTGLAIGDTFGDRFFGHQDPIEKAIQNREHPRGLSEFTDDTVMAIPIVKSLEIYGEINQDYVAEELAENYALDPNRGYGPSMHRKLRGIKEGGDWLSISKASFGGQGSMGNGVKMTAQDTVPMVIWNAYHELRNFREALWRTVSALGDRDTTCAMIGGMVTMSTIKLQN